MTEIKTMCSLSFLFLAERTETLYGFPLLWFIRMICAFREGFLHVSVATSGLFELQPSFYHFNVPILPWHHKCIFIQTVSATWIFSHFRIILCKPVLLENPRRWVVSEIYPFSIPAYFSLGVGGWGMMPVSGGESGYTKCSSFRYRKILQRK